MSDEEKEAIEILKLYFGDNTTLYITKYVNIVLNLIEKQSKEIEELNKKWEDKIKAKIEEDKFYKRKAEQLQWRLDAYERLSDCNEEFEL